MAKTLPTAAAVKGHSSVKDKINTMIPSPSAARRRKHHSDWTQKVRAIYPFLYAAGITGRAEPLTQNLSTSVTNTHAHTPERSSSSEKIKSYLGKRERGGQ